MGKKKQRCFAIFLLNTSNNGYDFDFSDIDSDDLMIATIQAANGVTDFLKQLFDENISAQSNEITMI